MSRSLKTDLQSKKKKSPSPLNNRREITPQPLKRQNQPSTEAKKPSGGGNYTKFSQKIFKGDLYLPTIIKESDDPYYAKCLLCFEEDEEKAYKNPKNKKAVPKMIPKKFLASSLYIHLDSKGHRSNSKDLIKLEAALKSLKSEPVKIKGEKNEGKRNSSETSNYLQFIGFLMSLNLSYLQIEKIGKYLQKAHKNKNLTFLPNFSFDQRLLSQLTQDCFSKVLSEELINQLRKSPYSIIVDNATFGGENLSAIKVKYLDSEWSEEFNQRLSIVQNKIVALNNLKESSTGQALKRLVEEKLFIDLDIQKNMIGFAHDNGSNLKGENIGLSSLIKQDGCVFLDLCDPCHGLNLSVKNSLKELPNSIMLFIQTISSHFSSPQNKMTLRNIQRENQYKELSPKHLAATRWMSLGQVLERLIEIWESLITYFDLLEEKKNQNVRKKRLNKGNLGEITTENSQRKFTTKEIKELLEDESFYLQVLLLSKIIRIANNYNIKFQDQQMSIAKLKIYCNEVYDALSELVFNSEMHQMDKVNILSQDFQDWNVHDKYFMKPQEFVWNITELFSEKFKSLLNFPSQHLIDMVRHLYDFIGRILNSFKQYLPLENDLISVLDFVELKDGYVGLKEKVKRFIKFFDLIKTEEERNRLTEEFLRLKNINIDYYRDPERNNLWMWDRLEHVEKLEVLPKIARFAESLPTSSATVEQSFSIIKLIKTDKRNRLKELSLEGLVLIGQEFRLKNPENIINERIIELSSQVIDNFMSKKKIITKKTSEEQKTQEQEELIIEKEKSNINIFDLDDYAGFKRRKSDSDSNSLTDDTLYPIHKKLNQ